MNNRNTSWIFVLQCCSLLLMPGLGAQETAPYRPKLTNNKDQSFHDFPLGVLSATGRLANGDREILVKDVGKEGAADRGGLKVGDRIVSVRARRPAAFSMKTDAGLAGPQTDLAVALEHACATVPHQLRLEVRRNGKTIPLKISVPASPPFASSFPKNCPKSKKYLTAIADHLVATQRKDGSWQPGVGGDADVYMSAFCALAVLAADTKTHQPAIKRAIEFIQRKSISLIKPTNPKVGPKNWQAASSAILLAEYHLATGDDAVLADLKKCCDLLAGRVSPQGTMGHHYVVGYNGGGLVIINTQAHLAWALAAKCGYKIDSGAWDRSLKEIRGSIDKKTGAIGYCSRAPSSPDISARTGAMAAALAIAGQEPKLVKQFSEALVVYEGRMRHAHAMSSIGLIYGMSGIKLANSDDHQQVMRKWQPYLELCRTSTGSAAYFGGKRNYGGDEYLGLYPIGNATVALILASAEEKLFMHGGTKKGWFGSAN
ncbi:MAG: PDZ domain-containing protein [Planctomycetes bacterium]|nr:PDZ domain-containing protein [Planctomycetota bacterium]